jgi:D-alanyl-D-alanine carboxypeptidase
MNKKAKEISPTGSNFTNSTGWPDPTTTDGWDIEVLSGG